MVVLQQLTRATNNGSSQVYSVCLFYKTLFRRLYNFSQRWSIVISVHQHSFYVYPVFFVKILWNPDKKFSFAQICPDLDHLPFPTAGVKARSGDHLEILKHFRMCVAFTPTAAKCEQILGVWLHASTSRPAHAQLVPNRWVLVP